MLRRLVQAYLASGSTAEALVADARLGWRVGAADASSCVENLVEALAPSNSPLLNPAALKEAMDTGGMSFVRGAANLVRDMARPPRIPSMVDPSPYRVGENIAATPGAVVSADRAFELIQYRPADTERCCGCRW